MSRDLHIRSMWFKIIVFFLIWMVIGFVYGDISGFMNGG